jgi:hypothetical protein
MAAGMDAVLFHLGHGLLEKLEAPPHDHNRHAVEAQLHGSQAGRKEREEARREGEERRKEGRKERRKEVKCINELMEGRKAGRQEGKKARRQEGKKARRQEGGHYFRMPAHLPRDLKTDAGPTAGNESHPSRQGIGSKGGHQCGGHAERTNCLKEGRKEGGMFIILEGRKLRRGKQIKNERGDRRKKGRKVMEEGKEGRRDNVYSSYRKGETHIYWCK